MRNLKNKNNFLILGLLIFIILAFCTVFLPKATFISLADEDGFFEYGTALFFLITSILFFVLFFQKDWFFRSEDKQYFSSRTKRIFFLLFGLMFFFFMGEEISWGQRIIGFETPESIRDRNIQNEFTFHNIDFLNHWKEGKELKSGLKALFTAKRIFVLTFVLYLFILPLSVRYSDFIKRITKKLYLPIPAIELGVLFILTLLIFNVFKLVYSYERVGRRLSEVEEFNFALILLFLPFVWMKWGPIRLAK